MVSNIIVIVEVVGGPPAQDESGPSAHMTKCRLCKKNKWPCVRLPGQTCNECMKAKAKCDKSLGWIGRRKDTKVADPKGKAPACSIVMHPSSPETLLGTMGGCPM